MNAKPASYLDHCLFFKVIKADVMKKKIFNLSSTTYFPWSRLESHLILLIIYIWARYAYFLVSFSPKQQAKMAAYCVSIFADMLLNKPLDDFPVSVS